MKTIKKIISALLCLAMVLSVFTFMAAAAPGDTPTTVDFPEIYPESALKEISKEEISAKVEALLKSMTEEEYYAMLGGVGSGQSAYGYGTGYMHGVPRLGVPVLRSWDGPKGVIADRQTLETTSPASQLALGQSWDRELAYAYGDIVGKDNRASAANMQLGTQVDVTRSMIAGRERDTISEEPYLVAQITDPYAKGIEDNFVSACLKHFVCYYAEFSHGKDNVIVDDQTLHEVWLYPFEYVLRNGNATSVMSAYNRINGLQAASQTYTQLTVLRDMWGFDGMVVTDWGGASEICIQYGTDLEMGSLNYHKRANIEAALAEGKIEWADVVTAVRHTLTMMGEIGYLGLVQVDENGYAIADNDPPKAIELAVLAPGSEERTALLDENDKVAYDSAVGSAVLLKNEDKALPVSKTDKIAMIGLPAARTVTGHYSESAFGYLADMTGAYEAMKGQLGEDADITFAIGEENIFGNDIPAEWLYVDPELSANGVTVALTENDETTNFVLNNLKMTTNSKTYKNAEGGNAVEYGQTAAVKTYLSVPESGSYGLKVMNAGFDSKNASIMDMETGRITQLLSAGGGCGPAAGAYGTSSAVCSEEGMDIPSSFTNVTLEAGKVYEITLNVKAKNDALDAQFEITYQTNATKAADEQAMIDAAANSDKILFFAYDKETTFEGLNSRSTQTQYNMLKKVIAAAKEDAQIIVILETAMPSVMRDWIDDVDAVLYMSLPGQGGGRAEAALLSGAENPSGKLSDTVVKSVDYTKFGVGYAGHSNKEGAIGNILSIDEGGEGIYNGYKWYDKYDLNDQVEFDFGYGLSYTTFEYSDLKVEKVEGETAYDVSFKIKNTGDTAGSEVAEVYLGEAVVPEGVQMAKVALAGFEKVKNIAPGETRDVTIRVEERQLSYWYTDMEVEKASDEKWVVAAGERSFYVGAASDDLRLEQKVNVAADTISGTTAYGKCGKGETASIDVIYNSDKTASSVRVQLDSEFAIKSATSKYDMEYNKENGKFVIYNAEDISAGDVLFTVTYDLDASPWVADGAYPVDIEIIQVTDDSENVQLLDITGLAGCIIIENVYQKGDVNRDGSFNNADLIMIARYLVDLVEFDAQQLEIADYNDDGNVDNKDLVLIARALVQA